LITHHLRKDASGQSKDISQAARGSSAMKAWADSVWNWDGHDVSFKQRIGSRLWPAVRSLGLERVEDLEGGTQTWKVYLDCANQTVQNKDEMLLINILRSAEKGEMLKTAMKEESGLSGTNFKYAFRQLEKTGVFVVCTEKRPAKDGKPRDQNIVR